MLETVQLSPRRCCGRLYSPTHLSAPGQVKGPLHPSFPSGPALPPMSRWEAEGLSRVPLCGGSAASGAPGGTLEWELHPAGPTVGLFTCSPVRTGPGPQTVTLDIQEANGSPSYFYLQFQGVFPAPNLPGL